MNERRAFRAAGLLAALLIGIVSDRTTGQPLPGVTVSIGAIHAVTRADGSFKLAGVKAGRATLNAESDDVPPQHFPVTVGKASSRADLRVCSTTQAFVVWSQTQTQDSAGTVLTSPIAAGSAAAPTLVTLPSTSSGERIGGSLARSRPSVSSRDGDQSRVAESIMKLIDASVQSIARSPHSRKLM
jgi:cytochrome c556